MADTSGFRQEAGCRLKAVRLIGRRQGKTEVGVKGSGFRQEELG
jgi:hypothetical protein